MTNEQIIEIAKRAGMEVHPRKMQIRVGADAALGLDSTAVVTRFAQLVRNAALEEAALKCDQLSDASNQIYAGVASTVCAQQIRSLKS